jgi:hypothetical protein
MRDNYSSGWIPRTTPALPRCRLALSLRTNRDFLTGSTRFGSLRTSRAQLFRLRCSGPWSPLDPGTHRPFGTKTHCSQSSLSTGQGGQAACDPSIIARDSTVTTEPNTTAAVAIPRRPCSLVLTRATNPVMTPRGAMKIPTGPVPNSSPKPIAEQAKAKIARGRGPFTSFGNHRSLLVGDVEPCLTCHPLTVTS